MVKRGEVKLIVRQEAVVNLIRSHGHMMDVVSAVIDSIINGDTEHYQQEMYDIALSVCKLTSDNGRVTRSEVAIKIGAIESVLIPHMKDISEVVRRLSVGINPNNRDLTVVSEIKPFGHSDMIITLSSP